MAGSSSSGIAYNPSAIDPYQVETTLAHDVGDPGRAASALPLLMSYRAQRNMQAREYAQQLDIQRALAQQHLDTEQMKAGGELLVSGAKENATGLLSQAGPTRGLYGNVSPEMLAAYTQLGLKQRQADIFKDAGAGQQSMAAAGTPADIGPLSSLATLPLSPGVPTSVQAQNAGAATATYAGTDPTSGATGQFKVPLAQAPIAQALAATLQAGGAAPGSSLPNTTPGGAKAPIGGPPPGFAGTVPPSPTTTSAAPATGGEDITPLSPGTARDQGNIPGSQVALASQWLNTLRGNSDARAQAAYRDMMSAAEAGAPIVVKGRDNRRGTEVYGVKGASGAIHWMV